MEFNYWVCENCGHEWKGSSKCSKCPKCKSDAIIEEVSFD